MFTSIIFWIKQIPWLIAGVLLIYVIGLRIDNNSLQSDLVQASKDIASRDILIEQQNSAILEWKKDYENQLKKKEQVEKELKEDQKQLIQRGEDAMSMDIPKDCNQAVEAGIEWGIGWSKKLK